MATPRETFTSRSTTSVDAKGTRYGVREFYTDYRDPQSCDSDTSNIPPTGSGYPGQSALRLDKRTNIQREDGTYIVRLDYSSNQSGVDNRIDKTPTTFWTWAQTRSSVTSTIYIAMRQPSSVPNGGSGPPTIVYQWVGVPFQIKEETQLLTLTVRAPAFNSVSPANAIKKKRGELHKIDGEYWKFLGADVSRSNNTDWEIVYQWVADEGTPKRANSGNDVFIPTPDDLAANSDFARMPFTQLAYIDQDDVSAGPGRTVSIGILKKVDNGWLSLPGIAGLVSP